MVKIICDVCGKEISLENAGKQYFRYEYNGIRVLVRADKPVHKLGETTDICADCVIDIIKNGEKTVSPTRGRLLKKR